MKKIINKNVILFLAFLLLVLSESLFFEKIGINKIINFAACLFLAFGIIVYYILNRKRDLKKNKDELLFISLLLLFVILLMTVGTFIQSTSVVGKLRILYPAGILIIIMMFSKYYLDDYELVRSASYGIIAGSMVSMALALLNNIDIFEVSYEGSFNWGLNGGLQFKNYFASTMLASFIGLFIYAKKVKRNTLDIATMIVCFLFIIISSSRGTYLLLALFLLLMILDSIKIKLPKFRLNFISILIIIVVAGALFVGCKYALNSATFMYRVRGVINYINYFKDDWFHLIFGNSEAVFSKDSSAYVDIIRRITEGYDGSYEMGFINILIKNGIFGLLGYLICYIYMLYNLISNKKGVLLGIGIFVILIISSFVESYVCSIHTIFGMYCYLFINGIARCEEKNRK